MYLYCHDCTNHGLEYGNVIWGSHYLFFYQCFTAQVCRTPGPIAFSKMLNKLGVLESWRKRKNFITGPGQP